MDMSLRNCDCIRIICSLVPSATKSYIFQMSLRQLQVSAEICKNLRFYSFVQVLKTGVRLLHVMSSMNKRLFMMFWHHCNSLVSAA
jgi:hypothetical protein